MFRNKTRHPERDERWVEFEREAVPQMDDLFRIAMWLVRDRTEAEDLVQETYAQALESFHRYQPDTNIRAWLVTIMYHTRSKKLRAAGRFSLVNDSEERIAESIAFEPSIAPNLTDKEVLQALEQIPPQYRETIVLSDVEELSYKEVAQILQVPIGTVMSRLNRGRKLLRAGLAAYANSYGIGAATRKRAPGAG
jgi:RNA polymerase sigma-70 factor (ECF subfamily)